MIEVSQLCFQKQVQDSGLDLEAPIEGMLEQ